MKLYFNRKFIEITIAGALKSNMAKKKAQNGENAAVYPGSFDPLTKGHTDIAFQGAMIFPRLYIVVGVNPGKNPLFTPDERVEMIRHEVDTIIKPRLAKEGRVCDIRVVKHGGLIAAFMKAHKAPFYVRGMRLGMEFDNEYPALAMAKKEYKKFTPVFLCTTDPHLQIVSSSLSREFARFGGKSLQHMLTPYIAGKLEQRIREKGLRIEP